jgi:hypothetical protein
MSFTGYYFLALTAFAIFVLIFWMIRRSSSVVNETFYVKTMEDEITDIYNEVLQRNPSGAELISNVGRIQKGTLTLDGLRQRLIESEEFERTMKTQSNNLAPELDRMLVERQILERLGQIYKEERKKDMPEKMVYPLRDIYIELDYNEYAFRAFLRDPGYQEFENEVMRMARPTKEDVLALWNKSFDKKKLMEEGARLKREADAAAAAAKGNPGSAASTSTPAPAPAPAESAASSRCIGDTDSDSKAMLASIQKACANLFDKDIEAQCLDKNSKNIILTHKGDMVLRPEYAWSVPQERPPVCTTLGQKPLIQPLMAPSSLLLGTPLEDAEDTQVGSIMPKFKYTEYISVPGDRFPTCAEPNCKKNTPATPVTPATPPAKPAATATN